MSRAARLRELMDTGVVLAPGVYNALFAKAVEQYGFDAVYVTGFGSAARYGYPDVGLITQTEMVANLKHICRATSLPVVADMDTGYGNIINARRTVREYERAGVAGFHIEDQVFPKKCGFMEGKAVIPQAEHVQKLKAAIDAKQNKDTVIIARTDALAPNGWDDTIARPRAYREAGADLIFVDGIRTLDELDTYSRELAMQGIPCLYNGGLVSAQRAQELGFKIQILAGLSLGAVWKSANAAMQELKASGTTRQTFASYGKPPKDVNEILGVPDVYEMERKYGTGQSGEAAE